MRLTLFFFLLIGFLTTTRAQVIDSLSQNETTAEKYTQKEGYINGAVLNASNDVVLQNVNIVNLNNVRGAITVLFVFRF